jgi:hypothetical protein
MNPTYLKSLAPVLGLLALVVVFRWSRPPAKQPVPAEFFNILHDCGSIQLPKPDSVESVRDVLGRTHAELKDNHLGDLFTYAQTRP